MLPNPLGVPLALLNTLVCTLARRYLVPSDLTVGQFVYVIRKRIKLSPEKAIFVFTNNTLPATGAFASATHNSVLTQTFGLSASLMSTVYEEHKDSDGFLCASLCFTRRALSADSAPDITYSGENTFGAALAPPM